MQYTLAFFRKIWSSAKLRRKLWFTAAIFVAFRLLANIPLPGVNVAAIQNIFANNQALGLLNIFSGGTLSNFSVVAVGINAFITASIIIQLASLVIPKLKELQKDGESGREQVNQYTRLLSIPLAVFQSVSVMVLLRSGSSNLPGGQQLLLTNAPQDIILMVIVLVAGSAVTLWLGELITQYGMGNGISMILLSGILSQIPQVVSQAMLMWNDSQLLPLFSIAAVAGAVLLLVVFMNEAVRRIPIQYARRVSGSRTYSGQQTHLPVRVNVTGVLPIIFAVTIMMVPPFLSQLMVASNQAWLQEVGRWLATSFSENSNFYLIMYFAIVFVFTYFSAVIFFNAQDLSDELKKSGAFVPGIRPGAPTRKYLEFVVTRITFAGALFLGLIAVLPIVAQRLTGIQSLAIGGTSVLIVVSVILETAKQIESQVIEHNYDKYV